MTATIASVNDFSTDLHVFGTGIQLLDRTNTDIVSADTAIVDDLARHKRKKWFCLKCRHYITCESERIEIAGNHKHRCTNPAGYCFDIGCYVSAQGCLAVDTPSSEHSWFSGCEWQIALCQACQTHLGWKFSGANLFFGLILANLVSDKEEL
jgi:hypothetical protein